VNILLNIFGDQFEPDDISAQIDVKPSRIVFKGTNLGCNRPIQQQSCWSYETGYTEVYDVNDVMIKLLTIFEKKTDKINELKEEYSLSTSLDIVIRIKNGNVPALYFNHETINFIHDIDASVDVDLYIC
jgi:hypothetical protein